MNTVDGAIEKQRHQFNTFCYRNNFENDSVPTEKSLIKLKSVYSYMNSTIQTTTIDSLLHSLIISKKDFKVGWPFTFATAKGEAQMDRFHPGI